MGLLSVGALQWSCRLERALWLMLLVIMSAVLVFAIGYANARTSLSEDFLRLNASSQDGRARIDLAPSVAVRESSGNQVAKYLPGKV
jgi:hypothetical protein